MKRLREIVLGEDALEYLPTLQALRPASRSCAARPPTQSAGSAPGGEIDSRPLRPRAPADDQGGCPPCRRVCRVPHPKPEAPWMSCAPGRSKPPPPGPDQDPGAGGAGACRPGRDRGSIRELYQSLAGAANVGMRRTYVTWGQRWPPCCVNWPPGRRESAGRTPAAHPRHFSDRGEERRRSRQQAVDRRPWPRC